MFSYNFSNLITYVAMVTKHFSLQLKTSNQEQFKIFLQKFLFWKKMTRLANPYITQSNPTAWTNLLAYIHDEKAQEQLQEMLTNSPIAEHQLSNVTSFLFFLNVPLTIVLGNLMLD